MDYSTLSKELTKQISKKEKKIYQYFIHIYPIQQNY